MYIMPMIKVKTCKKAGIEVLLTYFYWLKNLSNL